MTDNELKPNKNGVKTELEPCDDCISRQAVNDLVDELARAISDERCYISRGRATGVIMSDIINLPSVTPKEKTGKWIDRSGGDPTDSNVSCNLCNKWFHQSTNFCPNCGARMEVENE